MTELNSLCRISSNHSPPSPCHYSDYTDQRQQTDHRILQVFIFRWKTKRKYIERGPHFPCCHHIFWLQPTKSHSAITSHSPYTVKKRLAIFPSPARMLVTYQLGTGKSLPARDGKIDNLSLQCTSLGLFPHSFLIQGDGRRWWNQVDDMIKNVWAFSNIFPVCHRQNAWYGASIPEAGDDHRVHRVATVAFWRAFHHEGKISPGWWEWEVPAHLLSLHFIYHHQ